MRITGKVLSSDGITAKYIQVVSDGIFVETTYVNRREKHIICFSSQVGCAVGCVFCASGITNRFKFSLTSDELVRQCLNILSEIDFKTNPKPILFSCMGEGEPFLNFDAWVSAFHRLPKIDFSVPARLAVSTSGIKPELIRRLAGIEFEFPLKLQISLHGPTDEIRRQIIPVSSPLVEIVEAARFYVKRCARPIDLSYVMCRDLNDRPEHARALVRLLGPGWHVKFNRLNPTVGSSLLPSFLKRVEGFRKILEASGISTEYYETDGTDIAAACGQLSYHFNRKN